MHGRAASRLALALWLVAHVGAAIAAPTLMLGKGFEETELGDYVDVLMEKRGRLSLDEVLTPPTRYAFLPGAGRDTLAQRGQRGIWFRFALHNPTDNPYALVLQLQSMDPGRATLYRLGADGATYRSDFNAPYEISLQLPAGATHLYYLRADASALHRPVLRLYTTERYLSVHKQQDRLTGAVLGGLLMLILVALAAFLLVGESLFLWAGSLGLAFAVAMPILQGRLSLTEFDGTPVRSTTLAFLAFVGLVCSARVIERFPLYPVGSRVWRTALRSMIGGGALAIVAVWLLPARFHTGLLSSVIILGMLIGYGASLHQFLRQHDRAAFSYALLRLTLLLLLLLGLTAGRESGLELFAAPLLLLIGGSLEVGGLLLLLARRQMGRRQQTAWHERQVAVAEAEGRARTEVVAEVSHAIRTPASGMLGMLEILQETPLAPAQRDYLATAQRAGNELLNAVNEFSDLSRTQPLATTLEHSAFDPQALMAECLDGFRNVASAQQLELISDPAGDIPDYVSGDPARVRQIVLQLLHLAVSRYRQGEVVLKLLRAGHRRLAFELVAHGEPTQETGAAGDRRGRPDGAVTRLAITRQLVETLGGKLEVAGVRQGKTRLRVELPLPSSGGMTAEAGWEQRLRNKRVLLVDDNTTFGAVLGRQATHWGMQVHVVAGAPEAVAWLRNQELLGQPVDVLLLDADLGEVEDAGWLDRLVRDIASPPIIILLTSRPELADRERLQRLGVRRILLKPINHANLKITVAEELNFRAQGERSARPAAAAEPIHCLVAEDNVIATQVLLSMLDKLGARYTAVTNGQQAVEACQRTDFDVILMDGDMPVMDGWEAARIIRETQQDRGATPTPIIAITANTVEELGERARRSVMDAHLVKPIHLNDLRPLLERWIGKPLA